MILTFLVLCAFLIAACCAPSQFLRQSRYRVEAEHEDWCRTHHAEPASILIFPGRRA